MQLAIQPAISNKKGEKLIKTESLSLSLFSFLSSTETGNDFFHSAILLMIIPFPPCSKFNTYFYLVFLSLFFCKNIFIKFELKNKTAKRSNQLILN